MKLTLPLSVTLPRKTKADRVFICNLNVYRNSHHMTLNPAKVAYKEQVAFAYALAGARKLPEPPYRFTYTVFPSTRRAFDLGNVCSIIQKFTDDALIDLGVLTDDNFKIVREVNYRFGDVDKVNPRCELEIEGLS
jgi:hypothetical protein